MAGDLFSAEPKWFRLPLLCCRCLQFPLLSLSALVLSGLNTLTLRQLAPLDKPRDARLELMASIKQPGACIERTTSFPLRLQFSLAASAIKLKIAVNARKIISDAPQTSRQKDDSVPHCVVTHVKSLSLSQLLSLSVCTSHNGVNITNIFRRSPLPPSCACQWAPLNASFHIKLV